MQGFVNIHPTIILLETKILSESILLLFVNMYVPLFKNS